MKIIEAYVYAVINKLPEKSKSEVSKEIKGLIYDMMESCDASLSEEEKAIKVIEELGNPEVLSDNYRGRERYLIGPKYFNKYLFVLKIVLLSVFIGVSVASLVGIFTTNQSITSAITSYTASIFEALLQGAAWVTVIFAVFEYNNVNLNNKTKWSIKDLPQVPNKKTLISKSDSIFTIVFATIFFSILYFVPKLIGIYYKDGTTMVSISLFNTEGLANYKPMIILIFLLLIIHESVKSIWGTWTAKRAIASSLLSVTSSILTIIFFKSSNLWNNQVTELISKNTGIELISMVNVVVLIIVFAAALDIGTTLYKGFKYGINN